jgi:peptidoglycan hydrolase-like amidase
VVSAVKATTEKVVTYNGKIAVTPYFSQSDGRTRSWEEVWGNGANYPWCKSVADPYNEGKSLLGHGVGMSASGARNFADKEGKSYDWILKYYYTGIDITNMTNSDKRIRVGIYKL